MPQATDRYYTREEVLAFPADGKRYELVHGELLVSPAPTLYHQIVAGRLYRLVADYVHQHGLGEVPMSPGDLSMGSDHDVIVQPDVFVIPPESVSARRWEDVRRLLLVAEVLSPSSSRYDRFTKRRLYQEKGVPLYWIIDPPQRRAEVWTPGAIQPQIETERLAWHPDGATIPLVIALSALFGPSPA